MSNPTISATADKVTLSNGDLTLAFDRRFGGAPLEWANKQGTQLVSSFPGEGAQVVYDTGNDGTQASANGLTLNPVAELFDAASNKYSYYLAETSIGRAWDGVPLVHYQTSGIIPMFWASLEKIDDCVPPDPRGPMGWNTQYNNFLNLPAYVFTGPGVPLIFAPRGPVTSGMMLIGDEIVQFYNPGVIWNKAYTKIKNGRFAWRCNVSLKEAGADAIAGIIIRKEVPQAPTANINDLYSAHGYQLNFNKQGGVQLVKDNAIALWTSPKSYKDQLNSSAGLAVDIRTHYADTDKVDIWLGGQLVATVAGLTYRYESFGCFAQTTSGRIYFLNREPFDLNVIMTSAWFAYPDRITSVLGVQCDSVPMYRLNLPVLFAAPPIRSMWEIKEPDGQVWHNGQQIPWQIAPGLLPVDHVKSIWIGQQNGAGVGAQIAHCNVAGHMGISINEFAINPLPFSANTAPVTIDEAEVIMHYRSTRW
jgi:hypothetical protein